MPQAQKIPFLKLFSAWKPGEELAALVSGYLVTQAVIDKHTRSIRASVECPALPAEDLRRTMERSLSLTYRVERVELTGPDGREMAEGTFTMYRVSSEPPARLR